MASVMMIVMTGIVPDVAMRIMTDFAGVRIAVIVTIMVIAVMMVIIVMRAPVMHLMMTDRMHGRTSDMVRFFMRKRTLLTNSPCRGGRRLSEAGRHIEQDRSENQSRHNVDPSFHIGHRLSFYGLILNRHD